MTKIKNIMKRSKSGYERDLADQESKQAAVAMGVAATHSVPMGAPSGVDTNEAVIFQKIWVAIFLATVSTFFLLMTLSAMIFADTRSALMANAAVLTQWLPAVLALPAIRAAATRYTARTLLAAAEVASAVVLPLVVLFYGSILPLLALLLVKGGFDALSKVARPVALKGYFTGKRLDRSAAYYNIAALAGGGIGAFCGALVFDTIGLVGVLTACVGLHLAAATLYMSLPKAQGGKAPTRKPSIRFRALNGRVRAAFIYFVAAVCLFQGYHNIARSVFPTLQLNMSEASIPLIQTVTNVAYIVGALLAARIAVSDKRYDVVGPLFHGLALLTLVPIPIMTAQVPGIMAYAIFAFAFEISFCVHLRHLIVSCPADQLADVIARANAWAMGAMVALSLVGSYATEIVGLSVITLVIAGFAVLIFAIAKAQAGGSDHPISSSEE